MTQGIKTSRLLPPIATCIVGASMLALAQLAVAETEVQTEWVIAPKGTVLPEGTLLPEEQSVPGEQQLASETDAATLGAILDRKSTPEGHPYVSGGIGVSEREELARIKSEYNLRLLFAVEGSGEYLSDIQVRIDDASGMTRLTATSKGPWFYARLPPGRYNLTVDAAGQVQARPVTVPAHGAAERSFYWPPHDTSGAMPR
ncbi:carboxypeptidase regulatory-like domain-containing protein [Thioalkalicoccus limnaeus]|uniref:Carboxypeptidase regulatory-like domain-containing protein n=1 Tax=Thioalkalicoccus limnaeus TaxID=120681 RepID=A0ABV4BIA7_9GAMM